MGTILTLLFSKSPETQRPRRKSVKSCSVCDLKLAVEGIVNVRYCLPHTAWLKVQGKKAIEGTVRLVLALDTLRDSSMFASGQHTNYYKIRKIW